MDFYRRTQIVCNTIPFGMVATYGQVALLCGKPKNARQVGYALRTKIGGQVPAYRVVNGQGYLSGAGAFLDGPVSQKSLLREEGVVVNTENRVDLKKFGWNNSLDDALKLRDKFEEEGI